MDCILCRLRKGFVYVRSLNKPPAVTWSVLLTVLQKMPSSYANSVLQYMLLTQPSQNQLPKIFARTQSSGRCQNVEVSRNVIIISTALCRYNPLPLPPAHPRGLVSTLLYQKDVLVMPGGLHSHTFFFLPHVVHVTYRTKLSHHFLSSISQCSKS
jgi:hypothetical protein